MTYCWQRIGRFGLLALIAFPASCAGEARGLGSEGLTEASKPIAKNDVRCSKQDSHLLAEDSGQSSDRFIRAQVCLNASGDTYRIILVEKSGSEIELDRFDTEYGGKAEVTFARPNLGNEVRFLAVSYGFEPYDVNHTFLIDVYDLKCLCKIFSSFSASRPIVEDINNDGIAELVTSVDVFSVRDLRAPVWPQVFRLEDIIKSADLKTFPNLISDVAQKSDLALRWFRDACDIIPAGECPFSQTIGRLKMQILALDALLEIKK